MTMLVQLILVVLCLGQIAYSKPHGPSTKKNQGRKNDNLIGDVTDGSGDIQVVVDVPVKDKISVNPKDQAQENTCTAEYAAIQGHTMCLDDNPEMTSHGVAQQDQEDILNLHNVLRSTVDPPATDLFRLSWDSRLAAVADKWARQCIMDHDVKKSIPGYGLQIGQNVAGGYVSWEKAIMAWYNEVTMYRYGEDPDRYLGKDGWKKIGHFTQIVQNVTFLIGCGFANCPRTRYGRFYVCNYASGQSRIPFPYTRGERCSACPNTCISNLCDCGGKSCFNGGTLDKNTCTCSCPKLYTGPTCYQLNCPDKDSFYCGRSLVKTDCQKYYNVPQMCPYMCGICSSSVSSTPPGATSGSQTNIKLDQTSASRHISRVRPTSSTFTSEYGCSYSGQRASKSECRGYGDHGNDMSMCRSMGGKQVTCDHCQQFYNIKTDYCPVMCGLCDAPCGGKKCVNGGRLDTATCKCTCKSPYEGNTCQTANCPTRDPPHCVLYQTSFCNRYVNVPPECPFMCGIC